MNILFLYNIKLIISRSKKLDQEVFYINKLTVREDDSDYIVTCSWNGDTYIVDLKGEKIATFSLRESVSTFCSGLYTPRPNTRAMPCFVFITSSRKVII